MQKTLNIALWPVQREFILSQARHPALITGRAYGKSVAQAIKAVNYCLEHPGALGLLMAPTLDKIKEVIIPVLQDPRFFGSLYGSEIIWREQGSKILFPEVGSTILIRSGDNPIAANGNT